MNCSECGHTMVWSFGEYLCRCGYWQQDVNSGGIIYHRKPGMTGIANKNNTTDIRYHTPGYIDRLLKLWEKE